MKKPSSTIHNNLMPMLWLFVGIGGAYIVDILTGVHLLAYTLFLIFAILYLITSFHIVMVVLPWAGYNRPDWFFVILAIADLLLAIYQLYVQGDNHSSSILAGMGMLFFMVPSINRASHTKDAIQSFYIGNALVLAGAGSYFLVQSLLSNGAIQIVGSICTLILGIIGLILLVVNEQDASAQWKEGLKLVNRSSTI